MKKLTLTLLAFFLFQFLSAQTNCMLSERREMQVVFKDQLYQNKIQLSMKGLMLVDPLLRAFNKEKLIPDSMIPDRPLASRFYYSKEKGDINHLVDSTLKIFSFTYDLRMSAKVDMNKVLQPFYMKAWEVSNAEYKEFLQSLDKEQLTKNIPDTNCWVTDFPQAYVDVMAQLYFSHPKYQNHPVVGVSYYQAMAYCKWLETRLNQEYAKDQYRLEVSLPNQFEWAFANGDEYIGDKKTREYGSGRLVISNKFYDDDYFTRLILFLNEDNQFTELDAALHLPYHNITRHNYMDDGDMFPTSNQAFKRPRAFPDSYKSIYNLNRNVSEWCEETYQDNWKDIYEIRQKLLKAKGTRETVLLAELEAYYNAKNDTLNGQMVRGGNWVHEQHTYREGINVGTHSAKLFIDPNSQHSTLGFRYVIRVIPTTNTKSEGL